MLSGEVSYRVNYEKDDKFEKKKPQLGDLNFTVREAYALDEALPLMSKGIRIKLKSDDPALLQKVESVRTIAAKNQGKLPVFLDLTYPSGSVAEIDLGPMFRISASIAFLSELAKVVPQTDTAFPCEDKIYLAPPERKPWES
jgi:hypothetical protein